MRGDRYQSEDRDRYGERVEPANRTTAVHPYLVALLPLLAAWELQYPHVRWHELMIPATLLLVPAFALVIGLSFATDNRQRAALATSWIFLCLFGHGIVSGIAGGIVPGQFLAFGLVFVAGFGAWMITRADWCDESFTLFANVAGIAATLALGGMLGWQYFGAYRAAENSAPVQVAAIDTVPLPLTDVVKPRPVPQALEVPASPPDVYCFVYHRYAGPSTLQKCFKFDVLPFLHRLEKAGFVCPSVPAAGDDTSRSIGSLLNFEPAADLPTEPVALLTALRESRAAQLLTAAGYRYFHLGSPEPGLRDSPLAADNYAFFTIPSEFHEALLRSSVAGPWLTPPGFRARELGRSEHFQRIMAAGGTPESKQPRFVLAHFMVPGDEWKFDHDGGVLTADEVHRRKPADSYVRQVIYANRTIEQAVSTILAQPRRSIIVLVGDVPPEIPPEVLFQTKGVRPPCDLLAAVYLPDADRRKAIPKKAQLSDLFEIIFREYFSEAVPAVAR